MRNLIIPCFLLCLSCMGKGQPAQQQVTGYYPSWRWYDRGKMVRPGTINYSRYDIINYAFLDVDANGAIRLNDPWADKNLLLGPIVSGKAPAGYGQAQDLGNPAYHRPGNRFSDFAHKHKVRLVASLGGWAHSENFPVVAADPAKRARLASDCARIVVLYNLDGIDIDWEYPGFEEQGGTPADRQNFTLLIRQIRDALNGAEKRLKRDLLLTAACGASPKRMEGIDWPQVIGLLDGVNLMAYSFYGHWDPVCNHNAPLFPPVNATQPGFSCGEAVENLLDLGVPPAKINLGIAFFGRTQRTTGIPALHGQGAGIPDTEMFSRNGATPAYYEVVERINQGFFDYFWDDVSQSPYLCGKNGLPSFVSFDDERSIALKAGYVKCRNLHGVAIWDITADYLETAPGSKTIARTPLADAIRKEFSRATNVLPGELIQPTVCIFPNPTPNGYLQVFTSAPERADTRLAIYDTNGQKIHDTAFSKASYRLDLRALPAGPYLVQVKRGRDQPVLVRVVKK